MTSLEVPGTEAAAGDLACGAACGAFGATTGCRRAAAAASNICCCFSLAFASRSSCATDGLPPALASIPRPCIAHDAAAQAAPISRAATKSGCVEASSITKPVTASILERTQALDLEN